MIGWSDADVCRRVSRNFCDDIIINFPVIRAQPQVGRDVPDKALKSEMAFINIGLRFVRVVLGPESDLIGPESIEFVRNCKAFASFAPWQPESSKRGCGNGKR